MAVAEAAVGAMGAAVGDDPEEGVAALAGEGGVGGGADHRKSGPLGGSALWAIQCPGAYGGDALPLVLAVKAAAGAGEMWTSAGEVDDLGHVSDCPPPTA